MKLEDQVINLENAKRLKELGVNQKSLFYWSYGNIAGWYIKSNRTPLNEDISAFTVSELLELLPNSIKVEGGAPFDNFNLTITKFHSVNEDNSITNNFRVNYDCDTISIETLHLPRRLLSKSMYDPNLANALAKTLIYLLDIGLIKNANI